MVIIFEELMRNIKFTDMLNAEGSLVVGGIMKLSIELDVANKGRDITTKIFGILEEQPWLASMVALIFCFDTLLQNNPAASKSVEVKSFVEELEKRMKEGKLNNDGK